MQHNAVGAYIYAGGFSVGMQKHFNILAHLEGGSFGVGTVKKNLPNIPVYTHPDDWPVGRLGYQCHVVYSNPPCSPWSIANSNATKAKQQGNLVDHVNVLSLLDDLDPIIWVWESVTGAYGSKLSNAVVKYGFDRGYSTYHVLHDGKFLGLPQGRRRLFTVLSKVHIQWDIYDNKGLRWPIITAGEVIDKVTDPGYVPKNGYEKYFHLAEPGKRVREAYIKLYGTPAPPFLLSRVDPDLPARTQMGGAHLIHPYEDRLLGINEVKAICGYPSSYEFDPRCGNVFAQAGKAVTPPTGVWLGCNLATALSDGNYFQNVEPFELTVNLMARSNRIDDFNIMTEEVLR